MNAASVLLPLIGQYDVDLCTLELAMNDVRALSTKLAALDPGEAVDTRFRLQFADDVAAMIADRRRGLALLLELVTIVEQVAQAQRPEAELPADLFERIASLDKRVAELFSKGTP
jgi:hypothetical protein